MSERPSTPMTVLALAAALAASVSAQTEPAAATRAAPAPAPAPQDEPTTGTHALPRETSSHDYEAGLALADVVVEGDGWSGHVVSVGEDHAVVTFADSPGSRAEMPLEAIHPETRYVIERVRMDDTRPEAWIALATFAERHGLLVRHVEALERARALVEDRERGEELDAAIAGARARVARERLEHAAVLRAEGEIPEAQHALEALVVEYPATDAADEARAWIEELRAGADGARDGAARGGGGATDAAARDDATAGERARAGDGDAAGDDAAAGATRGETPSREDLVAMVNAHLESGDAALIEGLGTLGDHVEATRAFEHALESFRDARELVRAADAEPGPPGQDPGARAELLQRVKAKLARAHLELGHVFLARGDEQSAYHHAGRAATLDPRDPRVGALRRAIGARDG